jgi:hypothetical protein
MDEEKAGDVGSIGAFLEEKTFRARTVLVFGQITDTLAGATVGRSIFSFRRPVGTSNPAT